MGKVNNEEATLRSTKKLTTYEFIENAIKIHGYKYDYSLVEYINSKSKVKIVCKKHGIFEQIPNSHSNGNGCNLCSNDLRFLNQEEFIDKSNKIHKNLYDYTLVDYKKTSIKIKIICKNHGVFEQTPKNHLKNHGCPKCSIEKKAYTKDEFIKRSNIIHNNKYDYLNVIYLTGRKEVKISCKEHGEFHQKPRIHLAGYGCSLCSINNGERKISIILNNNNIEYIRQKTFEKCKRIFPLKFDFYLPEYNTCIEFNGMQHYKPIEYFGGINTFKLTKESDNIKKKFCAENNIKFIEIKYNESIDEKLSWLI